MGWRNAGGIPELARRLKKHERALAYDCRTILHVSLFDIELRELFLLLPMLVREPTGWLHAELANWDRPSTYEWAALADLLDVTMAANSRKRPKPVKRPWDKANRIGGKKTIRRSPEEVKAILRPEG